MDRRYVVIVSVVVALWASVMIYRHEKVRREAGEYRAKEYARITEVAKQSPKAGVNQMARALKDYYQKKRRYPSSLKELYPEYIRNQSFIDELDWYYEPKPDDFLLTKTVVRNNKRMIAAVDKRLEPWVQTGVMVAAPTPSPATRKAKEAEDRIDESIRVSAKSREEFWEALRLRQMDQAAAYSSDREKEMTIIIPQPEITPVAESRAATGAASEFGYRYLVWKSKQGTLGFGNVEYPAADTQTRYAMGAWYSLKMPEPEKEAPVPADGQIERKKDPETIASDLSRQYLVWKGQRGTLGFGNVRYPEEDHIYVFETDTWIHVPKPVVAMETGPEPAYKMPAKKSAETIASEFSRQYVVWKDQHGTLGFGNVECPEERTVSLYGKDNWIAYEKEPLPPEARVEKAQWVPRSRSTETIASEFSPEYLVWKDRRGNLGFGNVTYPDMKGISQVHVTGGWRNVVD